MMMTATFSLIDFMILNNSTPGISGSLRSRRTKSGGSLEAARMAAFPSEARETTYPSFSKMRDTGVANSKLSLTTKIFRLMGVIFLSEVRSSAIVFHQQTKWYLRNGKSTPSIIFLSTLYYPSPPNLSKTLLRELLKNFSLSDYTDYECLFQ